MKIFKWKECKLPKGRGLVFFTLHPQCLAEDWH